MISAGRCRLWAGKPPDFNVAGNDYRLVSQFLKYAACLASPTGNFGLVLVRVVLVVVALVFIVHMSVVLVVVALVSVVDVSRLVAVVFVLVALMLIMLVSVVLVSVALVNVVWHRYLRVTPKLGWYDVLTILAEMGGNSKHLRKFARIVVIWGLRSGKTPILSFNYVIRGNRSVMPGTNL